MKRFRTLLLAPLLAVLAGCSLFRVSDDERYDTLGKVAKDWSAVIRASQVVPVYPLTEDLRPGDLFLVQTTVDRQHEAWRRRGYLPLDHHLDRLAPTDYARFYAQPPGREQDPVETGWWRGQQGWERAPLTGFPSYRFRLSKGAGLDLAIPISAASVGLSLVGADAAAGSVSLRQAYTYGVGIDSLAAQVLDWNTAVPDRHRLAAYASRAGCESGAGAPPCNYLRVVNRVFLVQEVDVAISAERRNDASVTAKLSAAGLLGGVAAAVGDAPGAGVRGAAGAVDRVLPGNRADGDFESALKVLNRALAGDRSAAAVLDRVAKPVGRTAGAVLGTVGKAVPDPLLPLPQAGVTVRSYSDRTIALSETFARPLVIGYHAFDLKILAGGVLGAPVPTYAVLEDGRAPTSVRASTFEKVHDYDMLLDNDLPRCASADAILTAAVACLGPAWSSGWAAQLTARNKPPGRSGKLAGPSSAFRRIANGLRGSGRLGPPASGQPAHCPAADGAAFEAYVARLIGPSVARCAVTAPLR